MAKTINLIRIANAKLVSADIDKFGRTFAIQSPYNADGFSSVNVTVEQAPSNIKQYLEGNNSITTYPVPSNVDKLCIGALMNFPNIEDLYLFKNDGVVSFETASTDLDQDTQDYLNDLNYLTNLKLIFVASDYISSYSSFTIITSGYQSFTSVDDYVGKVVNTNLINDKYTTFTSVDDYLKSYVVYNGVMTYVTNDNKNDLGIVAGTTIAYFGASAYKVTNDNKNSLYIVSGVTIAYDRYVTNIVEDYTLTIPFVGDTKLTSEYVDSVIAMLSNAEKNAITKVVIPTDFSEESADTIAWGYDFSAIVNLDNNIWYGATQYDFSVFTIQDTTQDHILTASVVGTELGKISSNKLTLVEKIVVPIDFTSYASGSITAIQNGLPNLRYLETTYEEGAMELDLQGDIVAKITEIGKTLDEALVYAKTIEQQPRNTSYRSNYNVVIIPPIRFTQMIGSQFEGCINLVYVDKLHITYNTTGRNFYACSNLYQVKYMDFQFPWDNIGETFFACKKLEKIHIKLLPNEWDGGVGYRRWYLFFYNCTKLKEVILEDFEGYDMSVSSSTEFTRQDLVNLLNSIGSPTTQTTLTIGATNLAKLTADDIAIATQKNWLIQ